jgi:hypothetical protein
MHHGLFIIQSNCVELTKCDEYRVNLVKQSIHRDLFAELTQFKC